MAGHTLYGKTNVCYTEVAEFTDFQGIGRDPLYKRYDSVNAVVEKCIKKSKKYDEMICTYERLNKKRKRINRYE